MERPMRLSTATLEEFGERLAAGTPTPGGGSAAALAGSLAAALVEMVCGLTIGKEAYRAHEAEVTVVRDRARTLRRDLLAMVDRDAEAYDAVMAALRLPKGTDAEKAARKEALGRANATATDIPLATAECCAALMGLARGLVGKGNRNALSDLGTSATLAEAGLRGALMNVRINLPGFPDTAKAAIIRDRASGLEAEADRLRVANLETLKAAEAGL
jgi:methenyltetrahydrofolate cyclohydrolase